MSNPRVWLITGASTGIGRATTEHVLKQGDIVVATLRKPEVLNDLIAQYPTSKLLAIKLDVQSPSDIKNAFAKAKATFGRVDVVVNNAGWGILGEVEATPEAEARSLFDTNFWGAANVSTEAVRLFREENKPSGGLLLNISSIVGLRAVPRVGYYSASKHALEGLTQALALELDPNWRIKIVLVELGAFKTEGHAKLGTGHTHPAYPKLPPPTESVRSSAEGLLSFGDPKKAVEKIYTLSTLPDPPFRFALGKDAVAGIKLEIKEIEQDVAKYESWSEGLELVE